MTDLAKRKHKFIKTQAPVNANGGGLAQAPGSNSAPYSPASVDTMAPEGLNPPGKAPSRIASKLYSKKKVMK